MKKCQAMLQPRPFVLLCLYLWPRPGHAGWRRQRRVWRAKIRAGFSPGSLALNPIRGLRWFFFSLWRFAFLMVQHKGKAVTQRYGVTRWRQWTDLIRFNLLFHLPLGAYYRYRLFLPENRRKIHDRLYCNALPHVHDLSNQGNDRLEPTKQWLADKLAFAETLTGAGFPSVQTLAVLKDSSQIQGYFQGQTVFVKPQIGSHSHGAFNLIYHRADDSYRAIPINGDPVTEPAALDRFLREHTRRPMLVQKRLTDHPDVAALSGVDPITTLRLVTGRFNDGTIQLLYGQLEIPRAQRAANGQQFYRIYPLDPSGFEVSDYWRQTYADHLEYDADLTVPSTVRAMADQARDLCMTCHLNHIPIRAVAFDLGLTPHGPIIIEANYNWDIETLYRISDLDTHTPATQWLKELYDGD